jgi:hypothetical protein
MLNKQEFETEQFSTETVSTVTVSEEFLNTAANDGVNVQKNANYRPSRRVRRQSLVTSSPMGGWKVRMW